MSPAKSAVTLQALRETAMSCTRCPLAAGRTQVVFGVGNPEADLLFVGEGPGREEDLAGEPFVGRSGRLLDRLLREELGMDRTQCYIANVVKCRPPGNRDPEPLEIESCRPYLEAQVELINPAVVVTLGNFATRALLGTTEGIRSLRGRAYPLPTGQLVPTYHPAFALRSGGAIVAEMRADLVRAKRLLPPAGAPRVRGGEPRPRRSSLMSGDGRVIGDGWVVRTKTASAAETRRLAGALVPLCRPGDLVLLTGGLGAGKTVFAQGFAGALGVEGPVTSPTFTLVRQYACGPNEAGIEHFVHADLYRLDTLGEVLDLGLPELVEDAAVGLVEWGEVAAPQLGTSALHITLVPVESTSASSVPDGDEVRAVTVAGDGPGWADRRLAVAAAAEVASASARPQ